jgi:hypothetical protein
MNNRTEAQFFGTWTFEHT